MSEEDVGHNLGEEIEVEYVHDVYPGIDPVPYRSAQTYAGKVVLITGASRGIGLEIALEYARCGASIALIARKEATLVDVKKAIQAEVPGAKVAIFSADVADVKGVERAVKETVQEFGGLDIAIANAGRAGDFSKSMIERDPDDWWKTMEVNIRGPYNLAYYALPELSKTKGYFIIIGSVAGQLRFPNSSDYGLSKHALNRFGEFIYAEHPEVKTITLHPGCIMTDMVEDIPQLHQYALDTVRLPACTLLRMTSGKEDWLNGRYYSVNWDLDAVEREWKDTIIAENALVNRLHIPRTRIAPANATTNGVNGTH